MVAQITVKNALTGIFMYGYDYASIVFCNVILFLVGVGKGVAGGC